MLRNLDEKKILQALGRETRLVPAHAACVVQALSPGLSAKDAIADACEVFSAVIEDGEKQEEQLHAGPGPQGSGPSLIS